MKEYPDIDYQQAPASYWHTETEQPLQALLRNVHGTERRELIIQAWEEGTLDELPAALLEETLSENLRQYTGRLHPAFMGGEYLPRCLRGETEIARIELASTTADVISIRARPGKSRSGTLPGILYRVVDEYDTDYRVSRKRSESPLNLREIIELIDQTRSATEDSGDGYGLAFAPVHYNLACGADADSLLGFVTVSSEFYPGLFAHYQAAIAERFTEPGFHPNNGENDEEG